MTITELERYRISERALLLVDEGELPAEFEPYILEAQAGDDEMLLLVAAEVDWYVQGDRAATARLIAPSASPGHGVLQFKSSLPPPPGEGKVSIPEKIIDIINNSKLPDDFIGDGIDYAIDFIINDPLLDKAPRPEIGTNSIHSIIIPPGTSDEDVAGILDGIIQEITDGGGLVITPNTDRPKPEIDIPAVHPEIIEQGKRKQPPPDNRPTIPLKTAGRSAPIGGVDEERTAPIEVFFPGTTMEGDMMTMPTTADRGATYFVAPMLTSPAFTTTPIVPGR